MFSVYWLKLNIKIPNGVLIINLVMYNLLKLKLVVFTKPDNAEEAGPLHRCCCCGPQWTNQLLVLSCFVSFCFLFCFDGYLRDLSV